jgi:uncharacterized protein YjbI with pentapeptide repeats
MNDATVDTPTTTDAPKIGDAWGDDISEERQRELDAILAAWDAETNHGERVGPLDPSGLASDNRERLRLTGVDVKYLAKRSGRGQTVGLPNLHLEKADLRNARMEGADLRGAHLEGANLREAQLERANLTGAYLDGANLYQAQLTGANLGGAQLADADLRRTQLVNADLGGSHLERANLRFAKFDRETRLNGARFASVSLDQIVLDNTNLTVVLWEGVAPLGDEKRARAAKDDNGKRKSRSARIGEHEAALRANRLLATALRTQGLAEDADIFAYRAQLMQRRLRFQRRQFGRWLVSWGLALLSGYGYRLGRIFAAYAIVVLTFSGLFLLPSILNGAIPTIQQAADALQISINAIHGRVFFVQFGLDTLQSWLATAESVIGIVIEGVFVAMIIQRLFR